MQFHGVRIVVHMIGMMWVGGWLVAAGNVHWLGDYDAALMQAQRTHKSLMVLVVRGQCSRCRDVIRTAFMDRPYVAQLNRAFVPVIVTYGHQDRFPNEMYFSPELPALFFVDSRTEVFAAPTLVGRQIDAEHIQSTLRRIAHTLSR